jgi:signal transduction histidine kinase
MMPRQHASPLRSQQPGLPLTLFATEWLLLIFFALGFSAWLSLGRVLQTPDRFVHDWVMRLGARPADDRIIIIGIDDKSLKALGRWPWSRDTHARLLEQLVPHDAPGWAPPKGVLLDLLLSESDPQNDFALVRAMQALPKVVLPLAPEPFTANGQQAQMMLPAPAFREVAYLGYSYLYADADGVARSVAMYGEGRTGAYRGEAVPDGIDASPRKFAHAALILASEQDLPKSGRVLTGPSESESLAGISWVGPPGSFMTVPYVSVLKGEVPPSFFSNRYVLIGATATGLGDRLATPVSSTQGAMAGIEIHANVLDGVLNHRSIQVASAWQHYAFAVCPAVLAMLAYWLLAPRYSLAFTLALLVALGATSVLSLRWLDTWLSPSAAAVNLVSVYLLWSWRRLEAVLGYFADELAGLDREPQTVPELAAAPMPPLPSHALGWLFSGNTLERQMMALHQGIRRVRNLREFLNNGLESLPVALFITDSQGTVVMTNQASRELLKFKGQSTFGVSRISQWGAIEEVLGHLAPHSGLGQRTGAPRSAFDYSVMEGRELVTSHSRTLQLAVAPVKDTLSATPIGWLFALVDLSTERQIQAHRADLLRFLSHDLRTPQVSILAMLELQQDPATSLAPEELAVRVSKQVQHTLRLTDDLLQLAKAEAQSDYKFTVLDLCDLVLEAVDQVWPLAKQKTITIETSLPPLDDLANEGSAQGSVTSTWVRADGDLLRRAIVNLLHNAIRYSPAKTQVKVTVLGVGPQMPDKVQVIIEDQGIGIAPEDLPFIFERYRRLGKRSITHPLTLNAHTNASEPPLNEPMAAPSSVQTGAEVGNEPIQGLGLGLTQVKAVIDSHGGELQCTSTVGQGTRFLLTLPFEAADE